MKKLLIAALIALPAFAFAQTKPTPNTPTKEASKEATKEPTKELSAKQGLVANNPDIIYIEVLITETSTGTSTRVDIGRELIAGLQDKELVGQLSELRTAQFVNIPDAMTYLGTLGFKYLNSYMVVNNGKHETHLIFERRITRKPAGGAEKPAPAAPAKTDGDTRPATKQPEKK